MNNRNFIIIGLLISIFFQSSYTLAQQDQVAVALRSEIDRSMSGLKIDKMLPPNYISYIVSEANTLQIKATLGGLVYSKELDINKFQNRVLVGENGKTNENYLDENNIWSWSRLDKSIPINAQATDIQRALWLVTDNNYKNAITNYEAKVSAINQQSLSEEDLALTDFTVSKKNEVNIPYSKIEYNKDQLEELAKELSAVFADYSEIQSSQVLVSIYDAKAYFADSEGSFVKKPVQLISISAVAISQISSGEILRDHFTWYGNNINDLPDKQKLLNQTTEMAKELSDLYSTKTVNEPYSGPVLFEGQAVAEIFSQLFFQNVNGLIAVREPILGNEQISSWYPEKCKKNKLEARIDKKIISRDLTIKAIPGTKNYDGTTLIGSMTVDAEGVNTPDSIILVNKGVLTSLLSTRTPTKSVKESNGHASWAINRGELKAAAGPSVIQVTNSNPETTFDKNKLKEKLIAAAKEEDLTYAYIVRKLISKSVNFPRNGGNVIILGGGSESKNLTQSIQVYKVNVADGTEELVNLAEIQGLSIKAFKRLLGTTNKMQVYNTLCHPAKAEISTYGFDANGIPASFIVPDGILFEELDIVKEAQKMVKKPSIVENPVK